MWWQEPKKKKSKKDWTDWESLKTDRFFFNIQIMISIQCRFWVGKSLITLDIQRSRRWFRKGWEIQLFRYQKRIWWKLAFSNPGMNNLWSHEPWSTCELPLDGRSIQDRKAKKKRTKDVTAIGWNFWKEVEFGNNNCKSLSRWWFQRFFIFTST